MAETLFPVSIERKRRRYEKSLRARNRVTLSWHILDAQLPTPAIHQGYMLRFVEYDYGLADPVILYDKNRRIVHEWDYIPSLTDVFELCKALGVQ